MDQQIFDKFSTLKTVFYGQYRFKEKPSTGFIRRPLAMEKYRVERWLQYNARYSQPMGSKAPPQENVLATRSLDCWKIHLSGNSYHCVEERIL